LTKNYYHRPTVIVSSTQDPASTNMKSTLLKESAWVENEMFFDSPTYKHQRLDDLYLITIPDKTIIHENLEDELKKNLNLEPTRLIFISRHRSKTGEPTLTTHPIGNYGAADFGGMEKTLTRSLPHEMARLLRIMKSRAKAEGLSHHVCYEVTHHGPYLKIPTLFAEVGSDEKEWQNLDACRVVALSVLEMLETESKSSSTEPTGTVLVGVGGGHYAPRFTDVCLTKKAAFGHMIPTYHIKTGIIDEEMLRKTLDATPNVRGIYLHKKAMKKSDVTYFKEISVQLDVPIVSSSEIPDLE